MTDPRWETLAEILISHSLRLAAGETLLIECFDLPDIALPRLLVRKAAARGARALIETRDMRLVRELVRHGSEAAMRTWGEIDRHRMERVQAYLGLRGAWNISELTDVPAGPDGPLQHASTRSRSTSSAGSPRRAGACSVCPARAWPSRPA